MIRHLVGPALLLIALLPSIVTAAVTREGSGGGPARDIVLYGARLAATNPVQAIPAQSVVPADPDRWTVKIVVRTPGNPEMAFLKTSGFPTEAACAEYLQSEDFRQSLVVLMLAIHTEADDAEIVGVPVCIERPRA